MAAIYDPNLDMWPDLKNGNIVLSPVRIGMDRYTGKMLTGWDHVIQSMLLIFSTRYHERVLRRWCGSFVPHLLGNNATETTIARFYWSIAMRHRSVGAELPHPAHARGQARGRLDPHLRRGVAHRPSDDIDGRRLSPARPSRQRPAAATPRRRPCLARLQLMGAAARSGVRRSTARSRHHANNSGEYVLKWRTGDRRSRIV